MKIVTSVETENLDCERPAKALIPRRALFGNNVYAVANGRVQLRKVEVGYVSMNIAEITKGLDYLMQFLPSEGATRHEIYYFYGQYYAAQAMWQAGGQRWSRWYPAIRDELVSRQHATVQPQRVDGSGRGGRTRSERSWPHRTPGRRQVADLARLNG